MVMTRKRSRKTESERDVVDIPTELSDTISREFWCAACWDNNPDLSMSEIGEAWSQDTERVRKQRKIIRLGLFRLLKRNISVIEKSNPPAASSNVVNEVARELWVSQCWDTNPNMSYSEINDLWKSDVDRVREVRRIGSLAIARLARRGIGFVQAL